MLKIDLLPRHFAVARANKFMLTVMIVLLIVTLVGWMGIIGGVKLKIAAADAVFNEVHPTAEKTRAAEAETASKQADLKPIEDKVNFVADADKCGGQYWDSFHAINEYIYDKAQITSFSITGGSAVNFNAIVGDTTDCARFVLNLIRCPLLTNVSFSGLPAGAPVEGAGGATSSFSAGGGAGEMGMDPGMMGEPGMDMGMGMGMGGGSPGGQVNANGDIVLAVSATLVEPLSEPLPPGAAVAGGGGMGMGMGMGMEGPGMGPGMEGPGMQDPGMAPGDAGGAGGEEAQP